METSGQVVSCDYISCYGDDLIIRSYACCYGYEIMTIVMRVAIETVINSLLCVLL